MSEFISDFIISFKWSNLFPSYILNLCKKFYHVIILDLIFIVFLIKNNFSVVLGDKKNHSLTFHLAQINHFLFFALFFFPWLNTQIKLIFQKKFYTLKNIFKVLIIFTFFLFFMAICNRFSYVHEFLLSDNRHYSFYYFKKIYLNTSLRWMMIIYSSLIYSLILVENIELVKDSNIISCFICISMTLVPSRLFEFRYFAFAYLSLLFLVHYFSPKWKGLHRLLINRINLVWIIVLNLVTIIVFIKYPFKNYWYNLQLSRFMW